MGGSIVLEAHVSGGMGESMVLGGVVSGGAWCGVMLLLFFRVRVKVHDWLRTGIYGVGFSGVHVSRSSVYLVKKGYLPQLELA